ncbi:MAG: diguanylate cyclase [Desulfobacterales bacterium]|nr:diguanylate cyclase [Desulfobacterales bacterium]
MNEKEHIRKSVKEQIQPQALDLMLDIILEVMQAQRGSIMLLDKKGQELTIKSARGLKAEIIQKTRVRLGEGISGKVVSSGQPLTLVGSAGEPGRNILPGDMVNPDIRTAYIAPIQLFDGTMGTVNIDASHLSPEIRPEKERQVKEILRRFSDYLLQVDFPAALPEESSQLYMMNIFREYSTLREVRVVFDYIFYLISDLLGTKRQGILLLNNPESGFFDLVLGYGINQNRYREVYEELVPQLKNPRVDSASKLTTFNRQDILKAPVGFLPGNFFILIPLIWNNIKRGQLFLFVEDLPVIEDATNDLIQKASVAAARTIENSASDQRLHDFKFTDSLTGTYNYGLWWKRLHEEFSRAKRLKSSDISLIVLDIDQFDRFNQAHGYLVGDHLLRLIADRIKSCLRNIDMVGRIGGDEFGIALPDTPKADARIIADRIQAALAILPDEMRIKVAHPFSLSAGIAGFPHDGDSPEKLVEKAKMALVSAKIMGGGNIKLFAGLEE